LYIIGALQVAGGLLLLTGRWVPLGLTLLGPVIVNILAFHVLMVPAGLGMAIVVSALALFLVWRYRENFAGLVRPAHSARPEKAVLDVRSQPAAVDGSACLDTRTATTASWTRRAPAPGAERLSRAELALGEAVLLKPRQRPATVGVEIALLPARAVSSVSLMSASASRTESALPCASSTFA
jgi:hypothetical protein